MARPLTELLKNKISPSEIAASLQVESDGNSKEAGFKLLRAAADYGLGLRDYLTLAVSGAKDENANRYVGLTGYEAVKVALDLPHANDFEQGIVLQAAANSFNTYAGTRALFPEVIDDMLKFKTKQDTIENIASLVSQSRTVPQREFVTTYMEDDSAERKTFTITEMGNIPVRSVRTSENSVRFGKRGSGIEMSYEFSREASLDTLTPFAARIIRELELSKVLAATNILINGDGVNAAAVVENFSTYNGSVAGISATTYKALAKFLMARAKSGWSVDTFVVNFDMYVDLMFMFTPTVSGGISPVEAMMNRGAPAINTAIPFMNGGINVVISSGVPAGQIIAMRKAECIEELIMAGSNVSESERSIRNQVITYVKTEDTGYKLAIPQSRVILNTLA